MSLLSAFSAFATALIAAVLQTDIIYIIICISVTVIYSLVLVSHYFSHVYLGRLVVSLLSPIWVCVVHFMIGGYFCQSLAICASGAITYVAFQERKRLRRQIISFTFVSYFLTMFYVSLFGPYYGEIDFAYDEFVVFVAAMGWVIVVLTRFNNERDNLINNLRQKNEQLETTTEELERFTYIASHDLKSPLRTIVSFIGLIERDITNENYEQLDEKLQFVKSGAEQMNALVEDILEISRLNDPTQDQFKQVNLNEILENVKHSLADELSKANAVINSPHLPNIHGDASELYLLFHNIIQNGIKYNKSRMPVVDIRLEQHKKATHISFVDNGIGISGEYYEQIFSFFKRLHTNVEYQGTGLGLGLCKKIMNKYEGDILLESTIGQGSSFTLVFPIKRPSQRKENQESQHPVSV